MTVCGAAGPDDIYWAVDNNENSVMGTERDRRSEEAWRGRPTSGKGEV